MFPALYLASSARELLTQGLEEKHALMTNLSSSTLFLPPPRFPPTMLYDETATAACIPVCNCDPSGQAIYAGMGRSPPCEFAGKVTTGSSFYFYMAGSWSKCMGIPLLGVVISVHGAFVFLALAALLEVEKQASREFNHRHMRIILASGLLIPTLPVCPGSRSRHGLFDTGVLPEEDGLLVALSSTFHTEIALRGTPVRCEVRIGKARSALASSGATAAASSLL
ncbi:hypothetical protein BJ166DRAFT_495456 [Pestalotiopsis sp. NC0098]|nr:hypothetical protein BJ166DRAFT_495456 [Pestalotiopsis sp. NC0098]